VLARGAGFSRESGGALQAAYAELFFSPVLWPDFSAGELLRSLDAFRGRKRRFGK
jgi:undecaprenyl diphosphate synthase